SAPFRPCAPGPEQRSRRSGEEGCRGHAQREASRWPPYAQRPSPGRGIAMLTDKQQAALYFARKRHRIANSLAGDFTPVTTATVNAAYTGFTVSTSGGKGPYVYSVWGGAFPAGISIDASSGEVSGTPTETGTF